MDTALRPHVGMLAALWAASAAVLVACLLAAFRVGFAEDLALLLRANGARVALAAGAGAALALAGALRLEARRTRPLGELRLLAASSGAAGGGFAAAQAVAGPSGLLAFAAGAALGAAAFLGIVRLLERPARWTNAGVALALGGFIAVAALAGTYARARQDAVAAVSAWLLGDLSVAALPGSLGVLALAGLLAVLGARALADGAVERAGILAWVACGLGFGAAGLLAFVGSFVPRTVRQLAPAASPALFAVTSALAGAASVAAIDTVPRLLVGGYTLPFNVSAGMLAVPIFLLWNRARLRREAGPAPAPLEALELAGIALATAIAAGLVVFLTRIVQAAT
jgi:ABC-type Fe3+-siderophore transport system permease subunit